MEPVAQKNIGYLNQIKALSIVMVCFCHFVYLDKTILSNLLMLLCFTAVPAFLMVNGALLLNRPLDMKKHIRRILQIYFVMLAWRVVYLFVACMMNQELMDTIGLRALLSYLFLFGTINGVAVGHLWFINGLLGVYLVFPLVHACFSSKEACMNKVLIFILIVLACFTYALPAANTLFGFISGHLGTGTIDFGSLNNINPFGGHPEMLLYFIAGGMLHRAWEADEIRFSATTLRIASIIIMVVSLAALMVVKFYVDGTFYWDGNILKNGYTRIPTLSMSIAFYIFNMTSGVKKRRIASVFDVVGKSTLSIYYIHWLLGLLAARFAGSLSFLYSPLLNLAKVIMMIAIALLADWIWKKGKQKLKKKEAC